MRWSGEREIERLYLDTSVFGGYFDAEFELWTKLLFDKIIEGKYKVIYSELTSIELNNAPGRVKNFFIKYQLALPRRPQIQLKQPVWLMLTLKKR